MTQCAEVLADHYTSDIALHERADQGAREELTRRFMPFARSLAVRFRRGSEPLDDLVQVACLGLLKAIDRFDPGRGTPFQAYAAPTILGELKRHFRDKVMPLHVPRGLQERALEVSGAVEELTGELDRQPTIDELTERAGMKREEVLEALEAGEAAKTISLDGPVGSEDGRSPSVVEMIGASDPSFELAEARMALERALNVLDEREHVVVHLRFVADLTQQEIAERIGVSQVHVSRILRGALDKLRDAVGASD